MPQKYRTSSNLNSTIIASISDRILSQSIILSFSNYRKYFIWLFIHGNIIVNDFKTGWRMVQRRIERIRYVQCNILKKHAHSGPENLKKSRQKNSWNQKKIREISFLTVLNFVLVQKLIFGHFWNCKKNNFLKLIY